MPITNEQIAALPTYSTAELLKVCEHNIVTINMGAQAYGINGRTLTRANLPELYAQRDKLKQEIADEAAGQYGGGNVLVTLGGDQ